MGLIDLALVCSGRGGYMSWSISAWHTSKIAIDIESVKTFPQYLVATNVKAKNNTTPSLPSGWPQN
jgi:hypothetical protein